MKNYIIVSTCNRLVRQVSLAVLSMPGTRRITIVGNKKTKNLRWTSFCSENKAASLDQKDDESFIATINAIAKETSETILIPTDCDAARAVIRTRHKLLPRIVPIPESSMLETLDNKWNFYQFCMENDIRVPETIYVGEKGNLNFNLIVERLGLPFILKPVNQAGSYGVHVIRSEAYFKHMIENNEAYRFDKLIAQKYIDGIDLCFNFSARRGEINACSIQQRVGSEIHFVSNPALENLGYALARASAYDGVMCIDARVEKDTGRVYLIESNPRFWASLCASVWCGLNFVAEAIEPSGSPQAPLKLTSGKYFERHPLYRPSSWPKLAFDKSGHGRIFRTMMRDLPTLAELTFSIPVTFWNYVMRRVMPREISSLLNR